MKNFPTFIITSFLSLIICFLMFIAIAGYLFIPQNGNEKAVQKAQSSVAYTPPQISVNTSLLICIDECPVIFSVTLSTKNKNIAVRCIPKYAVNKSGQKIENFKDKNSVSLFTGEEYDRTIDFSRFGFEATVNYLGGIEIETPYGLPSPTKNKETIAGDEKLCVYGASLSTLLTEETCPSVERLAYYCYIMGELCLKFLKVCDTESYKFLNQNSETDISYTDFYDNYESLKSNISNAVCDTPEGEWKDGLFYLQTRGV